MKGSEDMAPNTIAYHEYAPSGSKIALAPRESRHSPRARLLWARSRQAWVKTLKAATTWAGGTKRKLCARSTAPKTKIGRTVTLNELLVAGLRSLRRPPRAADAYLGCDYVVADELSQPTHPDAPSRGRFDTLVTKAGLPRLMVQGLRHTAPTFMLADGVPLENRLGDAPTRVTDGDSTSMATFCRGCPRARERPSPSRCSAKPKRANRTVI